MHVVADEHLSQLVIILHVLKTLVTLSLDPKMILELWDIFEYNPVRLLSVT